MKNLTLQIDRKTFDKILKGEQTEERRNMYPYNSNRYLKFVNGTTEYKYFVDCFGGDEEKMEIYCWAGEDNWSKEQFAEFENIGVEYIEYTQMTLINGRRKNAPRLVIEIVGKEVEYIENENGEVFTVEWEGKMHPAWRICYKLGKILSTENI